MTEASGASAPGMPGAVAIVHDDACPFCVRCADWLAAQDTALPVELWAASDPEARRRWGRLPGYGSELVVVADDGRAWVGPDAFLVALWSLRRYRQLSATLTGPLARAMFRSLSSNRGRLGALLGLEDCGEGACGR